MKKFVPLVLALLTLSSCGPVPLTYYLEGASFENNQAIFSHDSSNLSAETASIDITVTRKTADIQELFHIETSDGPNISYWPSAIRYNGSLLTLGEEADEYGFLILNLPITDDLFTLHVEYDLTHRATGSERSDEVTDELSVVFFFNAAEFRAQIR